MQSCKSAFKKSSKTNFYSLIFTFFWLQSYFFELFVQFYFRRNIVRSRFYDILNKFAKHYCSRIHILHSSKFVHIWGAFCLPPWIHAAFFCIFVRISSYFSTHLCDLRNILANFSIGCPPRFSAFFSLFRKQHILPQFSSYRTNSAKIIVAIHRVYGKMKLSTQTFCIHGPFPPVRSPIPFRFLRKLRSFGRDHARFCFSHFPVTFCPLSKRRVIHGFQSQPEVRNFL